MTLTRIESDVSASGNSTATLCQAPREANRTTIRQTRVCASTREIDGHEQHGQTDLAGTVIRTTLSAKSSTARQESKLGRIRGTVGTPGHDRLHVLF